MDLQTPLQRFLCADTLYFNRSHDSLLRPWRKGLKLYRAAFHASRKSELRELLLLGTHSSHRAFWSDETATAQGFLWNLNDSEEDRETSDRSSFFMLFFTEARLYRRDNLSGSYILSVKTASSVLQTCILLLSTFRETLQFHYAIATVAIQPSTEEMWCDFFHYILTLL